MSIHHKWAERIYSGEKTIELRKTAPKSGDHTDFLVYIYDTEEKSVTGHMLVNKTYEVDEITEDIVKKSCVPREEIEKYKGQGKLVAWIIRDVTEYGSDRLEVQDLKAKRAPQSYQYIRR